MDDATLYANWYLWLGVATVLILVAAGLLIAVWLAARRILKLAGAALTIVTQIKENTHCIWALQDTNAVASNILTGAEAIEDHAGLVAKALHEVSST